MNTLDSVHKLQARMGESIIGQESIIEQLVIGLLANGNILMEGLPGLAKTRAVKSLAKNMDAEFSRIQFTPDLLPSDITGSEVLYTEAGQPTFRFEAGPIFANIVLADEINRAPAKVQAALLEAMEERQVTVAGTTHKMPELFIVMATQNPIEQEGTYPLPEAQMDRFLLHVYIDYGTEDAEAKVIRLVRGEEGPAGSTDSEGPVVQQVILTHGRKLTRFRFRKSSKNISLTWSSPRAIRNVMTKSSPPGYASAPAPVGLSDWTNVLVSMPGSMAVTMYCRMTFAPWFTLYCVTVLH